MSLHKEATVYHIGLYSVNFEAISAGIVDKISPERLSFAFFGQMTYNFAY